MNMKKIILFSLMLLVLTSGTVFAKTDKVEDLLQNGAGNSGKTPTGLEHAKGILDKITSVQQITDNDEDDLYPRVNHNGWITWTRNGNVLLYDGDDIVNIATSSSNWSPQINDIGNVAWMCHDGNDYEICLYDYLSENTSQITYNNYDDLFQWNNSYPPQTFNNANQIVWSGGTTTNEREIFLYDGTDINRLTHNSVNDTLPSISSNGHVVWRGGTQIYYYDGSTTERLTSGGFLKDEPKVGPNGGAVWMDWIDGHLNSEIFYYNYDEDTITRLTDNSNLDSNPKLNSLGQIIWESWIDENPNDREIFFYNGSTAEQLTDTSGSEQKSYISNQFVIWENPQTPPDFDFELFVFDFSKGTTTQITDNQYNDAFPILNDNAQAVWYGFDGNDWEIFLKSHLDKI